MDIAVSCHILCATHYAQTHINFMHIYVLEVNMCLDIMVAHGSTYGSTFFICISFLREYILMLSQPVCLKISYGFWQWDSWHSFELPTHVHNV